MTGAIGPYPATMPAASDPLATPYLDASMIERVVALHDPLERNAAITRGYHALSEAMAAIIGRDQANWLTFGQWASAEARRSIDGEAVPAALRPFVGGRVAGAVAAGNAAIFGDVAPPFMRFIRAFRDDPLAQGDDRRLARIQDRLCADPQLAASEDLTRAFIAYIDSLRLRWADGSVRRRRASRVFVANVCVGAHEQRVADPFVQAAIPGRWISAIVATSHMGLRLPDGVLDLSRDVPPPDYLQGAQFPPDLTVLDDTDELELARRFGQDPDSAANSDAPDWESYAERMGFIFTLLRSHQQDPSLFELPAGTPAA